MVSHMISETVIPIILMGYLSEGSLTEIPNLAAMREIFLANGWTAVTAVCFILLFLFHAPCSTTLLTVKKETGLPSEGFALDIIAR